MSVGGEVCLLKRQHGVEGGGWLVLGRGEGGEPWGMLLWELLLLLKEAQVVLELVEVGMARGRQRFGQGMLGDGQG